MTTLLPSRIPSGRWTHCTESSVTMTRAFIDAIAMVMKSVRVADSFYNLIEGSGPYTLWTPIAMDPQKKCPRDFAYQDIPFLWDMVTAPYVADNMQVSPKTADAFKKFIDPLRDELFKAQSSVNPVHNLFAASVFRVCPVRAQSIRPVLRHGIRDGPSGLLGSSVSRPR